MDAVIFDLDGTLWDTCSTCAIAWNRVLNRNGIAYRSIQAEDVRAVTGLPHSACIDLTFPDLNEGQRHIICEQTMLEDNAAVRELGGMLYPGLLTGLSALAGHFVLGIVSNCQSGYIETFLDYTGTRKLFTDFECWGNTGLSKGENLAALIKRNGFSDPVYIGDTQGDFEAARHCGIAFIQASYGFGEAISEADKVDSFQELQENLLTSNRT